MESLKSGGGDGKGGGQNGEGGDRHTPEAWKTQYAQQQKGMQDKGGPVVVDDDDDDEDDEDDKISVPLTITLAIIAVYIVMGAMLFGVWEGWTGLDASYFCFVTVSTIGFGDMVPGSATFESSSDQWKMVGAAIYMLFGMAILSMCFSLIQEEIVAKFRWVGEKLGIIEKDKDEDDDDDDDPQKDKDDKDAQKAPPAAGQQKAMGPPPAKAQGGMPQKGPGHPPPAAGPPGGYPPAKNGPPPPAAVMPATQKQPLPSVPPPQQRPPSATKPPGS